VIGFTITTNFKKGLMMQFIEVILIIADFILMKFDLQFLEMVD